MSDLSIKSIKDLEIFLNAIPKFSTSGISAANFSLESMRSFITQFGNPHEKFSTIHVAGTNGKGTVCQMLASVFQEAGYKTGLYTSPHLIKVNERFKINSEDISDDILLELFKRYSNVIQESKPTFFELTTAIAFRYFADQNVDIAIIETGLGGRLDATNIIDPVASVITSVGMDHMDVLGDSILKIAREKAGIIKHGKPVIIGNLLEETEAEVAQIATNKNSSLYRAMDLYPEFLNGKIRLTADNRVLIIDAPSRKKTDAINASIVFQTIKGVNNHLEIETDIIKKGIESVDEKYPHHAHFEKLLSDRNWYFDGAHNVEAIQVLIDELIHRSIKSDWHVVLSFMKDKLSEDVVSLWRTFPNIWVYAQKGERAATTEEMLACFPHADELPAENSAIIKQLEKYKSELVIFSGSFYFYETVRQWTGA